VRAYSNLDALFADDLNLHRRHLSRKPMRRFIERRLQRRPEQSDRKIAAELGSITRQSAHYGNKRSDVGKFPTSPPGSIPEGGVSPPIAPPWCSTARRRVWGRASGGGIAEQAVVRSAEARDRSTASSPARATPTRPR
jgi:hypothetical protein